MITAGPRKLLAKTCTHCGYLKQSSEFGVVTVGGVQYAHSYCHKCKNNCYRSVLHRHQQKAVEGAVRHAQPWTSQDLDRLREMAQRGLTGPQMAHALNRTVYAVYTMKNKICKET